MRPHLASLIEDFRRNGGQTAVVGYRGVRRHATSYGELARLAGRFAAEIQQRDIRPGDRVVLWGENSAAWIGGYFGCLLRGALAVPLDAAGSAEFAARVVADVQPRLVLGDAAKLRTLRALPAGVPRLVLDRGLESLPAEPLWDVDASVRLDAPFQIVFTSGTTSYPKGIVHTHRNVLSSLDPIEREINKYLRYERIFHPLRFLEGLPLSHVFGQFMGLWIPAVLAAEVHFDPQMEPGRMIERIREERISLLIAVPRTLELLHAYVLDRFSGLREETAAATGGSALQRWWRFRRVHRLFGWKFWALISGGAALPAELERFWGSVGYALIQGYGMTETAALVTLNHPFHPARGSIGKPLPGREVKLGPEGEILVRGENVSTATWKDGHIEPRIDDWLATGDLATRDASGELRFVGRQGDTIVTAAGLNIHPADLEAALLAQPGVRGAAVVGCHGANGPEPVAVLLAGQETLRPAVEGANRSLAKFQQIRHALRWPDADFPFTATGKLLRRSIADWACAEIAGSHGPGAPRRADPLLDLIARVSGEPLADVKDDARLSEDLHLDSLGRVQLQSLIEDRMHMEIADEQLADVHTLAQLRALVESQGVPMAQTRPEPPPEEVSRTATRSGVTVAASMSPALPAQRSLPTKALYHYYRWPWWAPVQAARWVFQEGIIRPLVWFLAVPQVVRSVGLAPQPPVLLIANHITAVDAPLVLYALPARLRGRVAIAMRGELLLEYRSGRGGVSPLLNPLMPLVYWLLRVFYNVFPLPQQGGFRHSFAHAGAALDHGYSVLVFPEGRRSQDGTLQPFQRGIGLLAQQAEVAVVLVALLGAGAMKARRQRWFRSGKLEVRVGEPIPYDADRSADEMTALLEAAMRDLMQRAMDHARDQAA